jgi:hypothetical protein
MHVVAMPAWFSELFLPFPPSFRSFPEYRRTRESLGKMHTRRAASGLVAGQYILPLRHAASNAYRSTYSPRASGARVTIKAMRQTKLFFSFILAQEQRLLHVAAGSAVLVAIARP